MQTGTDPKRNRAIKRYRNIDRKPERSLSNKGRNRTSRNLDLGAIYTPLF